MKFIIKDLYTSEFLSTFYADPHKITFSDFIDLFLKKCKYQYLIEENEYTIKNGITILDLIFFTEAREITDPWFSNRKFIELLNGNMDQPCIIHAEISKTVGGINYIIIKKPELNQSQQNALENIFNIHLNELEKLNPIMSLQRLDGLFSEKIEETIENKLGWAACWDTISQIRKLIKKERQATIEIIASTHPEVGNALKNKEFIENKIKKILSNKPLDLKKKEALLKKVKLTYAKKQEVLNKQQSTNNKAEKYSSETDFYKKIRLVNSRIKKAMERKNLLDEETEEILKRIELIEKKIENILKNKNLIYYDLEKILNTGELTSKKVGFILNQEALIDEEIEEILKNKELINSEIDRILKDNEIISSEMDNILKEYIFINLEIEELENKRTLLIARTILFEKRRSDYYMLFKPIEPDKKITLFDVLLASLDPDDYTAVFDIISHSNEEQNRNPDYLVNIGITKNSDLYTLFYFPTKYAYNSDYPTFLKEIKKQIQVLIDNHVNIPYPIIFYKINCLLALVSSDLESKNSTNHDLACDCCRLVLDFWKKNKNTPTFKNQTIFHLFNMKIKRNLYALLENNLIDGDLIPECLLSSLELIDLYHLETAQDFDLLAKEVSKNYPIFSFKKISNYLKHYLDAQKMLLSLTKQINVDRQLLNEIQTLATFIVKNQCAGDIFMLLPDEIYLNNPTCLWYLAHSILEHNEFTSAYEREVILNAQKRATSSCYFEKYLTDKTVARDYINKNPEAFDAITIDQLSDSFGKAFFINLEVHPSKEADLHKTVWQKGVEVILAHPEDDAQYDMLGEIIDSIKIEELDSSKLDTHQLRILKGTRVNKNQSITDWLVIAAAQGHFQARKWVIYQLNQHNKACWEAVMKHNNLWCYFIPHYIDKTVWLQHVPEHSKTHSLPAFCQAVIKELNTCDTNIIATCYLTNNQLKNLTLWQKQKGIKYPNPFIFNEDLNQYPDWVRDDLSKFLEEVNTTVFSPLRKYIEQKEKEYKKNPDALLKIKIKQLKFCLSELSIKIHEEYKKNEFLSRVKNTSSIPKHHEQEEKLYAFKCTILSDLTSNTMKYSHNPFIRKHRNQVNYFFSVLVFTVGKLFTCCYLMWPSSRYITAALQTHTIPTDTSLFLWKQSRNLITREDSLPKPPKATVS